MILKLISGFKISKNIFINSKMLGQEFRSMKMIQLFPLLVKLTPTLVESVIAHTGRLSVTVAGGLWEDNLGLICNHVIFPDLNKIFFKIRFFWGGGVTPECL